MKKCLLTAAIGKRFQDLSKLTSPLMLNYAIEHDYDFIQLNSLHGHIAPTWVRHEIKRLLDFYDYVFWADTDVVFTKTAPDVLKLPGLDTGDWDVAGAPERMEPCHTGWLNDYIKAAKLKEINIDKNIPYLCAGCIIVSKGFKKYYSEPAFPEIQAGIVNDQNALNYAIQIGRISAKTFPIGFASCPYLFRKPGEKIEHIWHFNCAMSDPHHYKVMMDFIDSLKEE
jgi:hypothetical protein